MVGEPAVGDCNSNERKQENQKNSISVIYVSLAYPRENIFYNAKFWKNHVWFIQKQ